MRLPFSATCALIAALVAQAGPAVAADALNIYSARHYESDDRLYDGFQEATGIPVNVIEGEGPELLARMRAEGKSLAGRRLPHRRFRQSLARGEGEPCSACIEAAGHPYSPSLKNPKNLWFGFSTGARMIFFIPRASIQLGRPMNRSPIEAEGKICMRSSSAIYNLSLMGALIAHWGPAKAEQWARGVVGNFARPPQGADTTLLQSVAAGECAVTLANHYYFVRLQTSKVRGEQDAAKKLTPIFPDQEGRGTHVNISGAGILVSAPHKANAVKFLDTWLATRRRTSSPTRITSFRSSPRARSRELAVLGEFKIDPLNVATTA